MDAEGLCLAEELTVGDNMRASQDAAGGGAMVGSAPHVQHPPEAADLGSQQVAVRPAQVRWCFRVALQQWAGVEMERGFQVCTSTCSWVQWVLPS